MTPIEPGDSGWPARKERLLEHVHARGQALHRRAQVIRGLSLATALLLLAAVPGALAASGGGGHKSVRTIGGPSTSTSAGEETTNPSVGVLRVRRGNADRVPGRIDPQHWPVFATGNRRDQLGRTPNGLAE